MAERIVAMHAAYPSGNVTVDGFLARPTAASERAAIVLVHGYRGLDDGQRAVTRRFGQEGFVCLSPDLFHGKTYNTLADCALAKTSLDIPRAVRQIIDGVPYLRKLPWVGKKPIAVLGFCMGGGLALYAVAESRAFAAGVIYYQSLFPDPEDLMGIDARLLCHYGTDDPGTTQTEIDMFRGALDKHKKKYEIEMYPGAGHAFLNNPQSKNAANRRAAEKSVVRTSKWLKKVLV
ncbi:MAG: dienelactone hydrolase family protein [Deltaproteobacteria bacterium]|nr:dienelactone hydrolase family protein [Deltaproteobacteria bacterium]